MTLDLYSYVTGDMQRQAANAIENAISSVSEESHIA
jgi:hypothetical protein